MKAKHLHLTMTLSVISLIWINCAKDPTSPEHSTIDAGETGKLFFSTLDQTSTADLALKNNLPVPDLQSTPFFAKVYPIEELVRMGNDQMGSTIVKLDTVENFLRILVNDPCVGKLELDTFDVLLEPLLYDSILNNENIIALRGRWIYDDGRRVNFSITDLDNDGVVFGQPRTNGKVHWYWKTTYTKDTLGHKRGEVDITNMDYDAGADRNFDTRADNQIFTVNWTKLLGTDTIGYEYYTDTDNDGVIFGVPNKSCIAESFSFQKITNDKSPLKNRFLKLRIEKHVFGKEKYLSYSSTDNYISGKVKRMFTLTQNGDTAINANDTCRIYLTSSSPAATDSIVNSEIVYLINPGQDITLDPNSALYEIHINREYRIGAVRNQNFDLIVTPNVPIGQTPLNGQVSMVIESTDGRSVSLDGAIKDGIFSGNYVGPDNTTSMIKITQSGSVSSVE